MPRKGQESYDASYLLNFRSGIPSDLPSTSYTPDYNRGNSSSHSRKSQKKLEAERQEARAREKMRSSFFLYASSSHAFVVSRQQPQQKGKGKIRPTNMSAATAGATSTATATSASTINSSRSKSKTKPKLKKDDKDNEADKAVAWESVRIVKALSAIGSSSSSSSSGGSHHESSNTNTTCAICLGEYIAPRITQCGHIYCYPCILRHLHSSEGTSMGKCPCCYHWVQQNELRPVEFVTVQSPDVSTIMEFRKLYRHRGCLAPFIPNSNTSTNNAYCNASSDLVNAHTDDANATIRKTVTIEKRVMSSDLPTATDQDACYSRTTYVDTDLYQQHLENDIASLNEELNNITIMYAHTSQNVSNNNASVAAASGEKDKYFVTLALQAVKHELELAVANADEENRLRLELDSIHDEHRMDVLPYKFSNENENEYKEQMQVSSDEGKEEDELEADGMIDGVAAVAAALETEHVERDQNISTVDQESNNTGNLAINNVTLTKKKKKKTTNGSKEQKLEPGMMYMGENCVQFYQAADGQLCFLSGFNLNCLSHEFSANDPGFRIEDSSSSCPGSPRRKQGHGRDHREDISSKPPFPDVIKGRVVEVERKHLTPDIRKRMGCFSHLPLYTDIILAELDIFHLSKETRNHFKKDFERRKNKRRAKREVEKKAERDARLKEEERIEDLKRGIQRIDPNDTFFHSIPAPITDTNVFNQEDFAHALPGDIHDQSNSTPNTRSGLSNQRPKAEKKMSFSSACTSTSDNSFPSLNTSNSKAFPSLASASSSSSFPPLSSPKPTRSPWKSDAISSPMTSPSLSTSQTPSSGRSRKKGKGKKTVLFSTGGRRSGY